MESLVNYQLKEFLSSKNGQYGFRKKHRTSTAVIKVLMVSLDD